MSKCHLFIFKLLLGLTIVYIGINNVFKAEKSSENVVSTLKFITEKLNNNFFQEYHLELTYFISLLYIFSGLLTISGYKTSRFAFLLAFTLDALFIKKILVSNNFEHLGRNIFPLVSIFGGILTV